MQTRTLVEDLACRNSSPDHISPSPYNGVEKFVKQFILDRGVDILNLIRNKADFDSLKSSQQFASKRLEDIDETHVYEYLKMVLHGILRNARGGIRDEVYNVETHYLIENPETNKRISEHYLVIEDVPLDLKTILHYREKMVSILKRLHIVSRFQRISLISLIIAYEKCKILNKKKSGVSVGRVREYCVYKVDSEGNMYGNISFNYQYEDWYNWLHDPIPVMLPSLHKDVLYLILMCSELDIRLEYENALDYNDDFMNDLISTYIPNNREYLSQEKVVKYTKEPVYPITSLVINFNALTSIRKDNREHECRTFLEIYRTYVEPSLRVYALITENGVYKFRNQEAYMFSTITITVTPKLIQPKALLHFTGYLILVTSSSSLYIMDIIDAKSMLEDYFNDRVTRGQVYNGKKFGTWTTIR